MPRLIVKNVGPIKDVDLYLSKVNVFMGPQSCGKSTLAKIISTCSWMEKRKFLGELTDLSPMVNVLCRYHKLGNEPFEEGSYIHDNSRIAYFGDNLNYFLNYSEEEIGLLGVDRTLIANQVESEKEIYHFLTDGQVNPKVVYIPSERNFVSRVSNLGDYNKEWDNLQEFVKTWFEAKSHFDSSHQLPLLNLGVTFFSEDERTNYISLPKNSRLRLEAASSGLQSIVPLLTLINWLSDGIYINEKPYSPNEEKELSELAEQLGNSQTRDESQLKEFNKLIKRLQGFIQGRVYTHTQFIVEEPEQNLFPETQCELMYYLLSALNHGKKHRLIVTTHSPYILYALNNCMLASLVEKNMPDEERRRLTSMASSLDPKLVRVWEIEDGKLKPYTSESLFQTIQDRDGLIRQNYFNMSMRRIMDEFSELLSYKH